MDSTLTAVTRHIYLRTQCEYCAARGALQLALVRCTKQCNPPLCFALLGDVGLVFDQHPAYMIQFRLRGLHGVETSTLAQVR